MELSALDKTEIVEELHDLYNPQSIGEIEPYPPEGRYMVVLYFGDKSFWADSRYNTKQGYNYYIRNVTKAPGETHITIRIEAAE